MHKDTESAILAAIETAQANKDHAYAATLLTLVGIKDQPGLQHILFTYMKAFAVQVMAVFEKIDLTKKAQDN